MTDRKQPGVAFWATVVAVAVLIYVLSYGPALWLWVHVLPPDACWAMAVFYRPIGIITEHSDMANRAMLSYLGLWIDLYVLSESVSR